MHYKLFKEMGVVSIQRDLMRECFYSMVCDLAVDHTESSLPMAFSVFTSLTVCHQPGQTWWEDKTVNSKRFKYFHRHQMWPHCLIPVKFCSCCELDWPSIGYLRTFYDCHQQKQYNLHILMLTNLFKGCKWILEFLTIWTHRDNDNSHYAADK